MAELPPICFLFAREDDHCRAVLARLGRRPGLRVAVGGPDPMPLVEPSGLAYFVPYTPWLEPRGGGGDDATTTTTAALRRRERVLAPSETSPPWLGVGSALGVPADGGASLSVCAPVANGARDVYAAFLAGLCLVEKARRARAHPCRGVVCRELSAWGAGAADAAEQVCEAVADFERGVRARETRWHAVPDALVCSPDVL